MKLDFKTIGAFAAIILIASVGSAYITTWVFSHRTPVPQSAPDAGRDGAFDPAEFQGWDSNLIWNAGTLTVNLQSPGSITAMNYVKATISLQVNARSAVRELDDRRVQVTDRLITTLRTTTKSELDTEEGISNLKRRIMDDVTELIADRGGRVTAVFFSELVTQ